MGLQQFMLHELIDLKDPKCLYCKSECDYQLVDARINLSSGDVYKVEIVFCRSTTCLEIFEIHSLQTGINKINYLGFSFTCKEFCVHYRYVRGTFQIGDNGLLFNGVNNLIGIDVKYNTFVPRFPVDFSDKDKLEAKLKTYSIFS